MNIHPDLLLDWCEGCVCNVCRGEYCHTRTIGNLWICNGCLQKQKGLWWDVEWVDRKKIIDFQLEHEDYSWAFRR